MFCVCVCVRTHTHTAREVFRRGPRYWDETPCLTAWKKSRCTVAIAYMLYPRRCKTSLVQSAGLSVLRSPVRFQQKLQKSRTQKLKFEHIELRVKLLNYFLRSNKSNINQYTVQCTSMHAFIYAGLQVNWTKRDCLFVFFKHGCSFAKKKRENMNKTSNPNGFEQIGPLIRVLDYFLK